jgi:hypothetical protein
MNAAYLGSATICSFVGIERPRAPQYVWTRRQKRRLKALLDLFSELQRGLRSPFDRVGEVMLSRQLGLNQAAENSRRRESEGVDELFVRFSHDRLLHDRCGPPRVAEHPRARSGDVLRLVPEHYLAPPTLRGPSATSHLTVGILRIRHFPYVGFMPSWGRERVEQTEMARPRWATFSSWRRVREQPLGPVEMIPYHRLGLGTRFKSARDPARPALSAS